MEFILISQLKRSMKEIELLVKKTVIFIFIEYNSKRKWSIHLRLWGSVYWTMKKW